MCGYGDDVGKSPYNGMVFGGNFKMFKSGGGCGACYQVDNTSLNISEFWILVLLNDKSFPILYNLNVRCWDYTKAKINLYI